MLVIFTIHGLEKNPSYLTVEESQIEIKHQVKIPGLRSDTKMNFQVLTLKSEKGIIRRLAKPSWRAHPTACLTIFR